MRVTCITRYSHFIRDQRDSSFHDFSIAHIDPGNRSGHKDRFFPRCSRDRSSQEDLVEIVAIVLRLQTNLVRDRCREAESVISICNFRAVLGHMLFSRLDVHIYPTLLDIFIFYLENLVCAINYSKFTLLRLDVKKVTLALINKF